VRSPAGNIDWNRHVPAQDPTLGFPPQVLPASSTLEVSLRLLLFRVSNIVAAAVVGVLARLFPDPAALSAAKIRTRAALRLLPPAVIRALDGTAGSRELLLMEPLVDLMNHRTVHASETAYDAATDTVTVRTWDDWRAGEQVLICYGAKPNRALLLSYGRAPAEPPRANHPCAAAASRGRG
jgi:hypothetical protein